jgi:hypothetical protein
MTDRAVQLREWPGLSRWRGPEKPTMHPRLGSRVSLVIFGASDGGSDIDRFGLGGVLIVDGPAVLNACLLVGDGLGAGEREAIDRWAASRRIEATGHPWQVATISAFFNPLATANAAPRAFYPRAYGGAGMVVGYDLGRFFLSTAEHVYPAGSQDPRAEDEGRSRENHHPNAWRVWPPGVRRPDGNGRRSPNRPELLVEPRRVGWSIHFEATKRGRGKVHEGRTWRGAFVDLASLCYALDAKRSASFGDHRRSFGLTTAELPLRVTVDAAGADAVAEALSNIFELALAVDQAAGRWFTRLGDRVRDRSALDLAQVSSPGALAAEVPNRLGVAAPLGRFGLDDDEHRGWVRGFHGGETTADPRFFGCPVPVVACDLSSAFPLAAHLLGWWRLLTADHLGRQDMTEALQRDCNRAAGDPTVALSPRLWRRYGFTLCEIDPDGCPFPVAVDDPRRPDGRVEVVPTFVEETTAWYAWPDVLAASLLARRSPRIIRATRLVPLGRQRDLRRHLPVVSGLVLDAKDDPVLGLVRRRREAKAAGDTVLAAELHALVNSLVSGNFSRMDEYLVNTARGHRRARWERVEKPGPFTFFPIATSVQAGSHLLLAAMHRLVADRGGTVVYGDTDSAFVAAAPGGGSLTLADGTAVELLCREIVDEVIAAFAPLAPDLAWPVWKAERGTPERPLHTVVFRSKRHIEFTVADEKPILASRTEGNLGGWLVDPAAMTGHDDEHGGRRWTWAMAEREIAYVLARQRNPESAARGPAPWDVGQATPSPALRRLAARTPTVYESLPASLGATPGCHYVEALVAHEAAEQRRPVALDDGGDLANWRTLRWVDRRSGEPVTVTTRAVLSHTTGAVLLRSIAGEVAAWSRPSQSEVIDAVTITRHNVQPVGRASGVIDAHLTGEPGDLAARRPRYGRPDREGAVREAAAAMGPRRFARVTGLHRNVAERVAGGLPLAGRTIGRADAALKAKERPLCACGCGSPLPAGRRAYVDDAHRERAKKRRARSHVPGASGAPRERKCP